MPVNKISYYWVKSSKLNDHKESRWERMRIQYGRPPHEDALGTPVRYLGCVPSGESYPVDPHGQLSSRQELPSPTSNSPAHNNYHLRFFFHRCRTGRLFAWIQCHSGSK